MMIKSAPNYYSFLTQENCPFFESAINKQLLLLASDLSWIDALEKEDDETYSRDYFDCEFPHFVDWPKNWQDGHNAAMKEADDNLTKHLLKAEEHRLDSDVSLYILDEEVYLSTQFYANGSIRKMSQIGRYDSAVTAAYIYINEYREWESKHSATYNAANILSSSESIFTDSQMGTSQECDGCGNFRLIVIEDKNHNVYCSDCTAIK